MAVSALVIALSIQTHRNTHLYTFSIRWEEQRGVEQKNIVFALLVKWKTIIASIDVLEDSDDTQISNGIVY